MEIEDLRGLVQRAARGDRDAAGALFDTYYPRVYRYALSRLRQPSEAEDVAAESFARVLAEIRRFRWRGAGFEAWLFRITSHLVVDLVRRRGREELATDDRDEESLERGPEEQVIALETAGDLASMLDHIPRDQREVLLLRFVAGLDTSEVARVMGRRPNAIRQLQFRALQNVRDLMHRKGDVG